MIATARLLLRPWRDEDLEPYAELNADSRVREFFPSVLTPVESHREARTIQRRYEREAFCLFAAELLKEHAFIGFIGIQSMTFPVPGLPQPAVEIGWRLASPYWGQGLAVEGARAVLRYAFETLQLPRVVAITVPANVRSRRVMEKLEMMQLPALDFDHPHVPNGHPLRRHVVYSITNEIQKARAPTLY